MGVNSLPKTVTLQRRGCDLNPGPSVPESSTLTTRLPSHPYLCTRIKPTFVQVVTNVITNTCIGRCVVYIVKLNAGERFVRLHCQIALAL